MRRLLKNLQKCVSNLKSASSFLKNEMIRKRPDPTGVVNQRLLLQRFGGDDTGTNSHYFSVLSAEDFLAKKQVHSALFEDFKVVVGSCNGLVCLDNTTNGSLLWNPSTGEFRIIPSKDFSKNTSVAEKHSIAAGFGYDAKSNDFKMVRFNNHLCLDSHNSCVRYLDCVMELYSLKNDSWKEIEYPNCWVLRNPSAYIDGFSYWLAFTYDDYDRYIIEFDYANESLELIIPPDSGMSNSCLAFVQFEGTFGVIPFPNPNSEVVGTEKCFHLWLSTGGGKYWTCAYEFCVPGAKKPLGFLANDRRLFFEGMNNGQLVVYDMTSGETTNLDMYHGKVLVPYVESMLSIKGLQGSCQSKAFIPDSHGRK